MSIETQSPPPGVAPPAKPGTSGLAIAGLILAFLMAPIGFILSVIALVQTGRSGQKGRGLAVAGVIVSLLAMIGTGVAVAVVVNVVDDKVDNISTIADPGCVSAKKAILDNSDKAASGDEATMKPAVKATADGLAAAEAKAKHDNVRNAIKALREDYQKLVQVYETGTPPPDDLEGKMTTDGNALDELCTLGGAEK